MLFKISHVFIEIAHDVILKFNIGVGRHSLDSPLYSKSLTSPLDVSHV